ncbi:MAG: protein-ADP-ribose hydrolase [Lachnospiraceae bacterium]
MKNFQTQEQRLDYLVDRLKKESKQYKELEIGDSMEEKRAILRSLMNVRMPAPIDSEIIEVQNQFLQEEAKLKGIVSLQQIPTIREAHESAHLFADKLSIWRGDITRLEVDAIVNAANSQMLGCFVPCHRCIDNAIHSAAGIELRDACYRYMVEKREQFGADYVESTGLAMMTEAYNLPSNYVIHTVGPIVRIQLSEELKQDLINCYNNVLKCCIENDIKTVAFCCISTGEFRFPSKEATKIAVNTVTKFLKLHGEKLERVIFNVFQEIDQDLYEKELK